MAGTGKVSWCAIVGMPAGGGPGDCTLHLVRRRRRARAPGRAGLGPAETRAPAVRGRIWMGQQDGPPIGPRTRGRSTP